MKKLNLIIALLMITGVVSLTTSCNKDEQKVDDTSVSADDAFAEGIFSNVTSIADEAYTTVLINGVTYTIFLP